MPSARLSVWNCRHDQRLFSNKLLQAVVATEQRLALKKGNQFDPPQNHIKKLRKIRVNKKPDSVGIQLPKNAATKALTANARTHLGNLPRGQKQNVDLYLKCICYKNKALWIRNHIVDLGLVSTGIEQILLNVFLLSRSDNIMVCIFWVILKCDWSLVYKVCVHT